MATTIHPSHASTIHDESPHEEGYLHYLAREGRWALRWCIGLCMAGIIVVMVSPAWFVAFIPAAIMLICGILLYAANIIERRSDRQAHDVLERSETAIVDDVEDDHAEDHQLPPQATHLIKRESRTGVFILFVLVLAALLVAYINLPLPAFAVGALVVFAYMTLIMAPVWLGWFNDDIEDETRRMEDIQTLEDATSG